MKVFFSLIVLSCVSILSYGIIIKGSVTLENSASHGGIKVNYHAVSPTASSDSTYTNANGSYTITVSAGIYRISLSKSGYNTRNIGQLLISKNDSLDHGTLMESGELVTLTKYISGTLYADTHYLITDFVSVEALDTLYIQPGTEISFAAEGRFYVKGELIARGTENNNIEFNLLTGENSNWRGMYIIRGKGNVYMEYCTFKNAIHAITVNSAAFVSIENCRFLNSSWGSVQLQDADSCLIRQCLFSKSYDLSFEGASNYWSLFEYNVVENMGNRGLMANPSMTIRYNRFLNNSKAISGTPGLVYRNLIYYNETGLDVNLSPESNVFNNTLYSNQYALSIGTANSGGIFSMNCLSDNTEDIRFYEGGNSNYTISYNFFESKALFSGSRSIGFGIKVSENNNGDSIDTYLNVIADDAKFFTVDTVHPHVFFPTINSPLVDAGNPIYRDEDESIIDIGAFPYVYFVGQEEIIPQDVDLIVYPNPFSESTTIQIPDKTIRNFTVFSLDGKSVYETNDIQGSVITFNRKHLESGIYLFVVVSDSKMYTGKLAIY
jgi:hypothetical protein